MDGILWVSRVEKEKCHQDSNFNNYVTLDICCVSFFFLITTPIFEVYNCCYFLLLLLLFFFMVLSRVSAFVIAYSIYIEKPIYTCIQAYTYMVSHLVQGYKKKKKLATSFELGQEVNEITQEIYMWKQQWVTHSM